MRANAHILFVMTVGVCLAGMIGCSTLMGSSADALLADPSLHILVNNAQALPSSGTFDFDTKLFKVADTMNLDLDLAEVDARVVASLEAELKRKGFRRDTENPDLLVSYALAADASLSAAEFNKAYADDFPIAFPEPEAEQQLDYHQGVLVVDFVGREVSTLLWRGAIMAGVSMEVSDREKERRVRNAVRLLLTHFPRPIEAAGGVAPLTSR